jgi:hypothetical protein
MLAGSAEATTAYTEPVGYNTLFALAGNATLLGINMHNPHLVAGVASISGNILSFNAPDNLVATLAGRECIVELREGLYAGKVIRIESVAPNMLTLVESLASQSNVRFIVRELKKLSGIINPTEVLATASFNPNEADLVLIPTGDGSFKEYYVSTCLIPDRPEYYNKWINAASGEPEDPDLLYLDAFFFLRRAESDCAFVITGSVKLIVTKFTVRDTFNYFSSVYPVGMTLSNSSLASSLQPGTAETADLVWIQDELTGGFRRYFVSDGTPPLSAGWRLADAPPGQENIDQGDVPMSPGFIIHRRTPEPYDALMPPPPGYPTPNG